MQRVSNALRKGLLWGSIGLAALSGACGRKAEPQWESVIKDGITFQHVATNPGNPRPIYRPETVDGSGNSKHYEFDTPLAEQVANDVDVGDEIRVRGPNIADMDIRDLYVTGHLTNKSYQYFRNNAGVMTKGVLYVDIIDLNGRTVSLKYEGHPATVDQVYRRLGPLPRGPTAGRLVKLPRYSTDAGAALFNY